MCEHVKFQFHIRLTESQCHTRIERKKTHICYSNKNPHQFAHGKHTQGHKVLAPISSPLPNPLLSKINLNQESLPIIPMHFDGVRAKGVLFVYILHLYLNLVCVECQQFRTVIQQQNINIFGVLFFPSELVGDFPG